MQVSCFSFGEELLLRLYDAVESCQFGNFLFDNDKEAVEQGEGEFSGHVAPPHTHRHVRHLFRGEVRLGIAPTRRVPEH